MEHKFVHNFCNIRGNGVFGQNWFCSIFSDLSLSLPRLGKFIVFFLCFFFLFTLLLLVTTWARRGRTTTRRNGSWTLPLPLLLTIYFRDFLRPSILVVFFCCVSLQYLITNVGFSFISSNYFGSARLALSSSFGENLKRVERPRN